MDEGSNTAIVKFTSGQFVTLKGVTDQELENFYFDEERWTVGDFWINPRHILYVQLPPDGES